MLGEPQQQKAQTQEIPESDPNRKLVKQWQTKIKKAKDHYDKDFERMRDNMDFVAGLQWAGQKTIKHNRYVVNMTLRAVNQGVAMLYCRNPQVSAKIRKRLNYRMWDGKLETVIMGQQIMAMASAAQQMGQQLPVPPDIPAMLQDFQQGRMWEAMLQKVGQTLETVFQYEMDSQTPDFKLQMKQLVRRVNVCGVGYIKVQFCRDYQNKLTQSETRLSVGDRMKTAMGIMERLKEGKIDENSADYAKLQDLIAGFQASPLDGESVTVKEHLLFDFPQATSIIPDPCTRTLKGFVGAHWIAEEFYYPLEFVNDFFELKGDRALKLGGDVKAYGLDHKPDEGTSPEGENENQKKKNVRLWEVYDLDSKASFMIADGHKDFIVEPTVVDPCPRGFWNIVPVTFNDIEVEQGCDASIFPPSAVDLIRPAQREWNETRNALSRHRKASRPRYVYIDGTLAEEDLDLLVESEDNQAIKLKGLPPGSDPSKVLPPLQVAEVKAELYDTNPLREDILLGTGQQESNLGPPQPNVTATASNTSEQSRMSVASSDIDGLDDSLSTTAQIGGEMLLKEMSKETVMRIAGIGAAWPEENKEDFVNEIDLQIVAASSGRPNRVLDINNWKEVSPLIMQAAQLPPQLQSTAQAVIRQTIKVLDADIEPADFFPIAPPSPAPMAGQPGQQQQEGQPQPQAGRPPTSRRPRATAQQPQ